MKIAVVYDGGTGDSLRRLGEFPHDEEILGISRDVEECLRELGHQAFRVPILPPVTRAVERLRNNPPDLVFNLCEGYGGDARQEGNIAGILDAMGLPYTGNGAFTLHLSLRKDRVKEIFSSNGIPTPRWFVADRSLVRAAGRIRFPAIVKPRHEDASVGIELGSVVSNLRDLRRRIDWIRERYRQPSIVEEYIEGRELNVSVVGGRVLGIGEIDFSTMPKGLPHIVTYRGKWDPESVEFRATVPVCPAPISAATKRRAEELALRCWDLLEGRGYARVDMRMDRRGRLYVLEFNPNPAFSRDAGLARAARAAGWSYPRLIEEIVSLAEKQVRHEVPETRTVAAAGGGIRA